MTNVTKTTRLTISMICLAAVLFLFYSLFLANRDKEISRVTFPDKTQEVVYLPDPSTNQRLKLIRFKEDGFTKISGTIFWNSGLIEDLTFGGPDNVVLTSIEYYPLDDKEGKDTRGKKRSDARFALDGSYTYHAVYRPDGTLERLGELQPMGTYNATFYFEDGKSVHRQRTFDEKKRYRSEKIFRRDGSLLASIYSQAGDYSKTSTMLYREDGTTYATFTRDPVDGEKGQVFAANGSTMILEYARDYYNLQEIYLDEKGNLIQNRDGSRMGNLLTVRSYREVGGQMLMAYRQRWMMTHTLGPDAEKVKLRRVEYYDFAAKRACEIQMDVAGTTPKTVSCPEANGTSTVKRLSEDGITVDTIDTLSKSNKVVATAKGNGARVDIPTEWLQNIRPTPLPNFKDEDAPPPVYDFH